MVNTQDGLKAIESGIEYIEQEVTPPILLSLKKWCNITIEKRQNNIKKNP